MSNFIDGIAIAEKIHFQTAKKVKTLKKRGITPKLAVILVGDDKPSATYVKRKGEAAAKIGIEFALHQLNSAISKNEIIKKILEIQEDALLSGLIVQLPLPEPLYTEEVLNAIDPAVDVDCLTNENIGRLIMNNADFLPPTPGAVMSILDHLKILLAGKNVTIVGVGALVGKPLAIMMMNARASVTTVNSATRDFKQKCLAADIIISGVGKKNLIRGDMVRRGAIVIDTGVDFVNGKMCGDVNVEEVMSIADAVTPTPGGVGPVTVARLLWNTAVLAEQKLF